MARYFQSTPQNFTSQFVPENLELQQGYFDNMQGKQDAYKLQIEGLNKQTNALVNDIPGAVEAKKKIEGRLGELRTLNYNDPTERDKAMRGTMELRGAFDTFGELGARDDKKKRYDLAQVEIEKDKNDFKKAFRLNELKKTNLAPERAIKFDDYGRPLNTEIIVPEDWDYKDKTKVFSELLKDVFADTKSVNTGLTEDAAHTALLSYMNGNIEERTGEKIYNSIKQRALADPNLMKSIQAEGLVYGQDPNALFETALAGTVAGGKYKKTDLETKYRTDALALHKAKGALDNEAAQQKFTTETGATESTGGWAKAAGLDNFFNEDGSMVSVSPGNLNVVTYSNNKGFKETITYNSAEERNLDEVKRHEKGWSTLENAPDTKANDKRILEGQTALYKKTSALGLNVMRPDGTIDGEATKENAINYFKGLSVYSNYTVPFIDASIVKNISNDLFGKTSNIHNMEIYEQGNPSSKGQYETQEAKAKFKDSKAVGLDYTATQPGAIKIIAPTGHDSNGKPEFGDTPFIAISRNKTLQNQMAPIQELTVKSLNGAKTGQKDPSAVFLTNALKGTTVKDVYGHSVVFEQLGIPVGSSKDADGTLRISYLDNSTGTPMIQVLEKKPNQPGKPATPVTIKSLDEVQEQKTGEIFNTGGALSQYQKQSAKPVLPSTDYEDNEE